MPRWLTKVVVWIRRLAASGRVRFTSKAASEIEGLGMGFDEHDCRAALLELDTGEFVARIPSTLTPEWLYVFRPELGGERFYVKLRLRGECTVISFHAEEQADGQDDQP